MGTYFQALLGIWVLTATTLVAESDDSSAYMSTYTRFNEIKEECSSVLAEASELPPDHNRKYMIQKELSFVNGDWKQQKGSSPLMPFGTSDSMQPFWTGYSNYTRRRNSKYKVTQKQSPINLSSFWVRSVDPNKVSRKMVNVSGILQLAISTSQSISYERGSPEDFEIYPGFIFLRIHLEGVYLELKNSQEERLLCMLGRTHSPVRGKNAWNSWDWLNKSESLSPTLLEDDKILLQLRYPSKLSLTSREIQGKLTSLNQHSNSSYFDEIGMSSQLTASSDYEFDSETLVAKACRPYVSPDNFQSKGIEIYRGDIKTIIQLMADRFLDVVPNWQCNGKDAYCSKLGPFFMDDEVNGTNARFDNTQLYVQGLIAQSSNPKIVKSETTKLRAVFRAVPPSQDQYLTRGRSGLNGLTLSAEGEWNSSAGQLCMVGCVGSIKNEESACNSRICIYIPLSFSIKQRSIIVGSIFSIENSPNSFYPLSFELLQNPRYLPWDVLNEISYSYSKTKLAESMLKKDEQIKKSFLKYPRKELGKTRQSFSLLSQDLSVQSLSNFERLSEEHFDIDLDVIAIEEFVGIDRVQASSARDSPHSKGPEGQKFLKVAAQLKVNGNFSMLFVEGLYDSRVGRMYLIGCRDVRRDVGAPWKGLHGSGDLQDGFDCLIEVKVEYPPTNTWWFINPTMKLSIKSQRTIDDPLFFKQIKIQTLPIQYRSQREEIISRKTVEVGLRILIPSLMIGCILSQLFYSRERTGVAPYISLVMLGFQAVGYSIPLITGAEALFIRLKSEPKEYEYFGYSQSRASESIDYMIKLLLLIACLLTLGLCQKVWKSRSRLLTRSPLEPWRVPGDKRVLAISSAIHAMGFLTVLIVNTVRTSGRPVQSSTHPYSVRNVNKQHEWESELREYVGLVQDFFLLPQIVGNTLWHFEGKPLRKLYYVGITVLRLLPQIYDCSRSPVSNPYISNKYASANPSTDFYSRFGDIAIPVTAVVLAFVIFIQQRWNKLTLRQALRLTSSKITVSGTRMYERLPLKTSEAELVSGCIERSHAHSTADQGAFYPGTVDCSDASTAANNKAGSTGVDGAAAPTANEKASSTGASGKSAPSTDDPGNAYSV